MLGMPQCLDIILTRIRDVLLCDGWILEDVLTESLRVEDGISNGGGR